MAEIHSTGAYAKSVTWNGNLRTALAVVVIRQSKIVARRDDTESDGESSDCSHGCTTFAASSLDTNTPPSISWALFKSDAVISLANFETASTLLTLHLPS